jgi:hypothetical protein
MKFTMDQMADFRAFAKVQHSGRYNMWTQGMSAATEAGLSLDRYKFVMHNYTELQKAAWAEDDAAKAKQA